jgi:23S rRNA (cytosine1962-C5)-methyltransferase
VLSAYCYTGAFEVNAAAAGATKILGVDRSEAALIRARENQALNRAGVPVEYLKADVPDALRRFRNAGETFDLIILDPPRFVANRSQIEKGLRAYKDINLLAMKLLTPGGILVSFSCSGQVSATDFKTMIGWSSVDAGRNVKIMETLGQPPDHPVLAVFPESEYLKGVICQVE